MFSARYIFIGLVALAACLIAINFYRTETPLTGAVASFEGVPLYIEVADTPKARERGLAGREKVPEDYGMLFVFDEEGRHGFWMKDMRVPLDIFWLTLDGHVLAVEENIAPSTYPSVFYPPKPVQYVLETTANFAKVHGIGVGSVFSPLPFPK